MHIYLQQRNYEKVCTDSDYLQTTEKDSLFLVMLNIDISTFNSIVKELIYVQQV